MTNAEFKAGTVAGKSRAVLKLIGAESQEIFAFEVDIVQSNDDGSIRTVVNESHEGFTLDVNVRDLTWREAACWVPAPISPAVVVRWRVVWATEHQHGRTAGVDFVSAVTADEARLAVGLLHPGCAITFVAAEPTPRLR